MANRSKKVLALVMLGLVMLGVGLGGFWFLQPDPDQELRHLRPEDIVAVRGRTLACDWLDQAESDYCDLTPQIELLRVFLIPGDRLPMRKKDWPCAAEFILTKRDGSTAVVYVHENGVRPAVLAGEGKYCYRRAGTAYHPLDRGSPRPEKWIAESEVLCELIRAVIDNDAARTIDIARNLRLSAGLE